MGISLDFSFLNSIIDFLSSFGIDGSWFYYLLLLPAMGWGATLPVLEIPFTDPSDPLAVTKGAATVTFTRNSVAWHPNDSGVYSQYGVNSPGVNATGIWLEPARTNYCTNYNAVPDEAITNVSVTDGSVTRQDTSVDLADAGLGNISPQYSFRYINSSGSAQTISIAGATGATSAVSYSVWARITGGDVTMQLTGAQGEQTLYANASFQRFIKESVTHSGNDDVLQFVVPDGVMFEWVLNQLEIGVNVSSPIVVAGASATRAATSLTLPVSTTYLPSNCTIYAEFTGATNIQDGPYNPVLFRAQKDSSENIVMVGQKNFYTRKRLSNTAYESDGRFTFDQGTFRVLMRLSTTDGVDTFIDGVQRVNNPNTDAHQVTSGTIHLGKNSDNTLYFNGQIRGLRFYDRAMQTAECLKMTNKYTSAQYLFIPYMGLPVYDGSRIWALSYSPATGNYDGIKYSDNDGISWATWLNWGTEYSPSYGALAKDSTGNFYFYSNSQQKLYRADATTQAITHVLSFQPVEATFSWFPGWAWTEDGDGHLYTTGYTMTTGGHYIWKSTDGGENWTRIDQLVDDYPNNRHVHSMHYNPYDSRIYVSWGDDASTRGMGYTADKFATAVVVITDASEKGPTGITFTPEAVYSSTDIQGDQNYVKSNDGTETTKRFITLNPYNTTPLYYVRAIENEPNELWLVSVDDAQAAGYQSSIMRLQKTNGVSSPWRFSLIGFKHEPEVDNLQFYAISHNGQGIIPAVQDYVYVQLIQWSASPDAIHGVYRIKRDLTDNIGAYKYRPMVGNFGFGFRFGF